MVASRWPWRLDFLAAASKRSISAVVRYSRVRTEEFTVVGADRPPVRLPTIFCPRSNMTSELSAVSAPVESSTVRPSDDHVHYPLEVLNRAADIFRMAGHMLGQRLLLFLLHHGLGVSFEDDGRQPFPLRRN